MSSIKYLNSKNEEDRKRRKRAWNHTYMRHKYQRERAERETKEKGLSEAVG